jgi:hypothetical protein
LTSPWDIKNGYIEYLKGKTRVEELYAQNGDSTVTLNTSALLFDEVPGVIGDETIVDHQGIRSFETLTEYSQLNADSLYFTYAPDFITNYRDVRESSFTPEKLSIKDSLEVAQLTNNALKFDYSEFPGDYAYYGHDSLSFAYNYNVLLPFFSNMDANKLEFWSVGGESKHYAGASEHYIADDSLIVSAFGIVNKGNSANTAYDRFRLEANDFTMRNDARWTTFDFITPANTNATTFKMYPGTGLSEYFTLGPSPFDPLSAQLTMQTDSLRSVCLAGHDGVGQLCLYDHGVTAFQMTAQGVFGGAEFTMFDKTELIAAQLYINSNNHPEFEMNTGIFRINNNEQNEAVTITTVNDGGQMTLYGPNGFANTSAGGFFNPNHGYSTVNGSNGLPNAWMLASEKGGMIQVFDTSFMEKVNIFAENNAGKQTFFGSNGQPNIQMGTFGNVDRGFIGVNNENGTGLATLSVVDNGGALVVSKSNSDPGINAFINGDKQSELDIFDGLFRMYDSRRFTSIEASTINGFGTQKFFGENGKLNVAITEAISSTDHGLISIYDENELNQVGLAATDNGGAFLMRRKDGTYSVDALVNGNDNVQMSVYGGDLAVRTKDNFPAVVSSSVNGFGEQKIYGPNGKLNFAVENGFNSQDHGQISVYDESELNQAGLAATDNGGAFLMRRKDGTYSVDALVNGNDNVQMSVYGGDLAVRTKDNFPAVVSSSVNGFGEQKIYGPNGKLNFAVENGFNSQDHGQISVYDESELNQVGLAATDNGGAFLMRRKDGTYSVDALVNGNDDVNMSIYGGSLNVRTKTNFPAISASSQNGFGELNLYGGDNQAFMRIGASGAANNNGHLFLNNSSGSTAMGLTSNDDGGVFFVSNTNSFATISNTFDDNDRIILDISSGDLKVNSGEVGLFENNKKKASIYTVSGTGQMVLNGANNNTNVAIGTFPFFGDLNRGYVAVNGTDGAAQGYLTSNDNGGQLVINNSSNQNRAGIFTNEFGQGVSYADVKNFKMDHPQDETKEIWYASLEGPEAAAYERGTATLENGTAFIPFTEHYQLVANAETMTVLVTPLSAESTGLAVVEKTDKGFYVKELFKGKGTYQFDWEVKSVRKGYENFEVIRDKKN